MAQQTVESTDNLNAGRVKINDNFTEAYSTPNFIYNYEGTSKVSIPSDYGFRNRIDFATYRLKPSHVVGSGGSDYTKALETICSYVSGELWIKFTGDTFDVLLERKIVTDTGTLSTITAGVSRVVNFQRFKNLIPKFILKSGVGAATVDVQIVVQNPKTMVESRVIVERWDLDDGSTFGDKPWYPPRLSTKFLQSIISHPFYDRMYLLGVADTLNDADYTFEKTQSAYATIKTVTANVSNVNDRGYLVIPFTCELANCLQITYDNSAGTSTITDQFVKFSLI